MSHNISNPDSDKATLLWAALVQKQVSSLRFGVVQITVHEGRVVQVETTERLRFDKADSDPK